MKLKNYDELIPQIARMMLDHYKNHTCYQQDINLYVNADGVGRLELFDNVGGTSWIDDDHYTLCSLPECNTDWTDTVQDLCSIADALGCTQETLLDCTAEWVSKSTGWNRYAADIEFNEVRDFINEHYRLRVKIDDVEAQRFEDAFSDYVDEATEILDGFLQEQEVE